MVFKPFCSTEIAFVNKEDILSRLLSLGRTNTVLVLSESAAKRWNMYPLVNSMHDQSHHFTWIKDISTNPTQIDIRKCLKLIGDNPVNLIISIGGGSSIDLAKSLSAFYDITKNSTYTISDITARLIEKDFACQSFVDLVVLPTTAGTGSEVTQWATIWDAEKTKKFSIDSPKLQPKLALIAPELTASLPGKMTLSTGLDAMCQAIEAYWSKHTNPVVQEIAYRAVELIIDNLRTAINQPADIQVREKLCKASVLAGLAFAQTRTTACHSISYPLTMHYGVPHGIAASITLNAVGQLNIGCFPNDKELYALFDRWDGIEGWIDMVSEGVITMRLSSLGIGKDDIPQIADKAFTEGRMDNNPVELTRDDVIKILDSIY